jgi:hypothetical protein
LYALAGQHERGVMLRFTLVGKSSFVGSRPGMLTDVEAAHA